MSDSTVDTEPVSPAAEAELSKVSPNIGHVLFIALIVGAFAALWLVTYQTLNAAIWGNNFVVSNRWTIPVGVLFFSLLVGLVEKYLHAPNMIEGGITESLKAGEVATYRTFWGTLLSSFFSLFSGASVGPEAPIGFLAVEVSEWLAAKLRFTRQGALLIGVAGMSSAYNGLVGNPVFATLLASEVSVSK